jgi:hypothetical protein
MVAGIAQMPHAWLEGSTIRPHVHWVQSSAGNVLWQLEYRLLPAVNGAFPSSWTTISSSTTTHAYPGSGSQVMITSLGDIDMTGFSLSSMVLFRLSRVGGDAADTVSGDVSLLEFDIHHQIDSRGSESEFTKTDSEPLQPVFVYADDGSLIYLGID